MQQVADKQYELAGQYPDEHVVLVGERIVHHGADRLEAVAACRRAAIGSPAARPVIVSPGDQSRKALLVRGRALAGKGHVTG